MNISINKSGLLGYLLGQINVFFPDGKSVTEEELLVCYDEIIDRTHRCFSKVNNKYFYDGVQVVFNHLNSDQYSMFLYFVCNTLFKNGADLGLCTKVFQLNKLLHGIDVFYEIELPEIFLFVHPLGTVLGRGTYSDYFLVYQRCGVGSNRDVYPEMKKYLTLRPGSSILGDCQIEENCTLGAGSLLLGRNLESNSLYIGNPKSFTIKKDLKRLSIWK
jgi:serine O-acetyltransferase